MSLVNPNRWTVKSRYLKEYFWCSIKVDFKNKILTGELYEFYKNKSLICHDWLINHIENEELIMTVWTDKAESLYEHHFCNLKLIQYCMDRSYNSKKGAITRKFKIKFEEFQTFYN